MRIIAKVALALLCPLIGHPPITSFSTSPFHENDVERATNLMLMNGVGLTVECLCGRKMVDPIWRPSWRKSR